MRSWLRDRVPRTLTFYRHDIETIEVVRIAVVAISAAHELGYAISAFDIIPNLFYPYLLAVSSFFFIAIDGKKKA